MIHRIDVRTTPLARGGEAAIDPVGEALRHQIQEFGANVGPITASRIFLIDSAASGQEITRAAGELLADPVVEQADVVAGPVNDSGHSRIEIHLKPGVMDPVAASTEMALRDMGIDVKEVRTGRAYLIEGKVAREQLQTIANRVLANGVIESVHFDAYVPQKFETGREYRFELRHLPLRNLTDEQLATLSRQGHLFLSLAEMKAIQAYYREQGREPTDVELETLAQTWSEHCVHKTLKSAVDVQVVDESGKVIGTRHYKNLIKETIFASTQELMRTRKHADPHSEASPAVTILPPLPPGEGRGEGKPQLTPTGQRESSAVRPHPNPLPEGEGIEDFCLSVFADNAGVIAFDETDAVCFKVETHNHPSAIEPYGGSATGAGGVIRDILGTGLAAKPIANTDVFCVAFPDAKPSSLPRGVIHPKRILQQVVAGVRDYGNRMGIPTVNGAVYFDDNYIGNPLVFCGCVGLIPRDKIHKETQSGDAIVVMGGRTGRDGIHGATFSSAELTDTHADEFSHAVQIGNAITEKKMADVILQARDRNLFTAITDCGAGGLSSAVGEMGEKLGAQVELDKVPLKYAGLRYDEIWISEAQERMVLSVPESRLRELLDLAKSEDVEATVIGRFGTESRELVLHYRGQEVGRISMDFLHHGIPMPTRKAVVVAPDTGFQPVRTVSGRDRSLSTHSTQHGFQTRVTSQLLALLGHPNIASKHWIIRQYDHEVQGGSVIKPLTGPLQVGPSDAAVLRPKLSSYRGVALGCGLAPQIEDPYAMVLAAIDEAIRNVIAVGADPDRIAILDNFCWPSVDDEKTMGSLVRACEACRDAALAYRIPFISGKDSLHNQFTNSETGEVIRIPNTLLISAIGVIDDVRKCITMDFKQPGAAVYLIEPRNAVDPSSLAASHRRLSSLISQGRIAAAHDVSDGGYLVAAAEMAIASGIGFNIDPELFEEIDPFVEFPGRYLLEGADPALDEEIARHFGEFAVVRRIGFTQQQPALLIGSKETTAERISIAELTTAWRGTLDW